MKIFKSKKIFFSFETLKGKFSFTKENFQLEKKILISKKMLSTSKKRSGQNKKTVTLKRKL